MDGTQSRIKALKKRASTYVKEESWVKAWQCITDILNIDFDDPQGLYLAGICMRNQGHVGLALQMFRKVVALDPEPLLPWLNFGACLHDTHHYDEAIEVFEVCRQKDPEDVAVFANMGAAHVQKGEFADALNCTTEALKRNKNYANAQIVQALAYLGLGRWKEGFMGYRAMYGKQILLRQYGLEENPEWNGQPGQTVVIQGDQGLGDEIRFASVIPDLAKECTVIYDCHPKLVNVFKRSFPGVHVHGTRKSTENVKWIDEHKIDARYHVSGLGRFYRARDRDFPRTSYLVPSEELRQKWRNRLSGLPRPFVGVAWQGGSIATLREHRSLDVEDLSPISEIGGTLVDLSYHDSTEEVNRFNAEYKNGIVKFHVEQSDYDDTLALVAELDLVLCVPTTIFHAAGAIGKPAWILVPEWPAWEFTAHRDDMIWYAPGLVKFFRNTEESSGQAKLFKAYKEWMDASGFHWTGPSTTPGLYSPAKLHYSTSEQASTDYPAFIAPAANQEKRPDGVHF